MKRIFLFYIVITYALIGTFVYADSYWVQPELGLSANSSKQVLDMNIGIGYKFGSSYLMGVKLGTINIDDSANDTHGMGLYFSNAYNYKDTLVYFDIGYPAINTNTRDDERSYLTGELGVGYYVYKSMFFSLYYKYIASNLKLSSTMGFKIGYTLDVAKYFTTDGETVVDKGFNVKSGRMGNRRY